MAEQTSGAREQWKDIAPTPPTTFPTSWFIFYVVATLLILPLHLIVCAVSSIYRLLMYLINFAFYYRANQLLAPIKASPDTYVIVTGAASGIGKDMASVFASKGFSLVLIDISADLLQKHVTELRAKFSSQHFKPLVIDLSKPGAATSIYDTVLNEWQLSNTVVLVNCAGFGMTGEFLNAEMQKTKAMITVNATSGIELGHAFGRYFVQRGVGRICQIASVAAFVPGSHAAVYHATKSMVRAWAVAFQHELIGTGVAVTVVNPGPVKTNFVHSSNSHKSLIFGALSWFAYDSRSVANAAVNATLKGKREIVYGPLWHFLQNLISMYGEAYSIISVKFMWQDPEAKYRNPFAKYEHQK